MLSIEQSLVLLLHLLGCCILDLLEHLAAQAGATSLALLMQRQTAIAALTTLATRKLPVVFDTLDLHLAWLDLSLVEILLLLGLKREFSGQAQLTTVVGSEFGS